MTESEAIAAANAATEEELRRVAGMVLLATSGIFLDAGERAYIERMDQRCVELKILPPRAPVEEATP